MDEDRLADNAAASVAYVGETRRTFTVRMAEEDNNDRADGARTNWELSYAARTTESIKIFSLMVGVVPNNSKRMSLINEGLHAALHTALFIQTTNDKTFSGLMSDGVLLNTMNCGIAYFVASCPTVGKILRWLKIQSSIDKTQNISDITDVPKGVSQYIESNLPRILMSMQKLNIAEEQLSVTNLLAVMGSWGGGKKGELTRDAQRAVESGNATEKQQQRVDNETKRIDDLKKQGSTKEHAEKIKEGQAKIPAAKEDKRRTNTANAQRSGTITRRKVTGGRVRFVSALPQEKLGRQISHPFVVFILLIKQAGTSKICQKRIPYWDIRHNATS